MLHKPYMKELQYKWIHWNWAPYNLLISNERHPSLSELHWKYKIEFVQYEPLVCTIELCGPSRKPRGCTNPLLVTDPTIYIPWGWYLLLMLQEFGLTMPILKNICGICRIMVWCLKHRSTITNNYQQWTKCSSDPFGTTLHCIIQSFCLCQIFSDFFLFPAAIDGDN